MINFPEEWEWLTVGDTNNRILIVSQCNSSSPFGEHLRPYYISKYLARMGWKIDHVCPMLKEDNQTVIQKPYMSKKYSRNPHLIIRHFADLSRIASTTMYSLIYVHGIRNQLLLTKIPKRTPTVFDVHGLGFVENSGIKSVIWRFLEKRVLSFPDAAIVTSNRSARMLQEVGIDASKLRVVTNGVDQNEFVRLGMPSRNRIKRELGLDGKFVVASINNPSEPANVKALMLMESAAKMMSSLNIKDVLFLVIGVNASEGSLEKNVEYTGFIENLNYVLNAADAAILSYPDDAERSGPLNKTLQFMACELPIVSTINGMRGIENATSGVHYVLSEATGKDLVDNLLMLRKSVSIRSELGRNARSLILRDYTWEKQAGKINDLLENMGKPL